MAKDNRKVSSDEVARTDEATTLETLIRRRARGLTDAIVQQELEAALGGNRPAWARCAGLPTWDRHARDDESCTTFALPRAWVKTAEGATAEWRSALVPRYQRRSARVDEAILRRVSERHEYVAHPRRVGAVAALGSVVERCGVGVRADGERVVLDVRLAGDESTAAWRDVIRSLVDRHVTADSPTKDCRLPTETADSRLRLPTPD